MNQYIITEERLAEYEEYFAKKKGKSLRDYQEGVSKEIRSHPYNPQAEELVTAFTKGHIAGAKAEREKVLDILKIIERSCNDVIGCPLASSDKTLANELLYYIRVYKEELRQEGKREEKCH